MRKPDRVALTLASSVISLNGILLRAESHPVCMSHDAISLYNRTGELPQRPLQWNAGDPPHLPRYGIPAYNALLIVSARPATRRPGLDRVDPDLQRNSGSKVWRPIARDRFSCRNRGKTRMYRFQYVPTQRGFLQ